MSSSIFKKEKMLLYLVFVLLSIGIIAFVFYMVKRDDNNVDKLIFENISNKKEVGRLNIIEDKDNNIYYKIQYPVIGNEKIDELIKNKVEELRDNAITTYKQDGESVNTYYFIDYEIYMGIDNTLSLVLRENIELDSLKETGNVYTYLFDVNRGEYINNDDIFEEGYEEVLSKYDDNKEEDINVLIKGDKVVLLSNDKEIEVEDINDYLKLDNKLDKDYTSDIEEDKWNVVNKEYVVIGDVVLYDNSSLTGEIIDSVKKDEVVKVYKSSDKGWSMLLYKNGIAFIESKNIKEKPVKDVDTPSSGNNGQGNSTNTNPSKEVKMYATTDLNLRKEAKSNSELLGVIKTGEEVVKIGTSGGWTQVKYKEMTGYVSSAYLTSKKIVKKEVKLNVPPQGNIDPNKPMVALSFDDGPNGKSTPRILDTLEKYNVHATFFDLGSLMLKYPDIVKREEANGEVGTHTYSHKNLNTLSQEALAKELKSSVDAYKQVLGYEPKLLRPPYGNANANVKAAITDMAIVNWNVDSLDWKYRNVDLTLNEIDKYGNLDGKIILMHSIYETTADAVLILVPDLLDRGYQIVSVSELAYYKGYKLETGTIYYGFK